MAAVTKMRTPPRRGLLAAAVLVIALVAAALALALSRGGSMPRSTPPTTHPATTTTPTTAETTTTPTTTAPPATADQALASVRAAIAQAVSSGQLDAGAAADLNHRLDDIAANPNDAAQKAADLQQRLNDLVQSGALTSAGYTAIAAPLAQLTALLPAVVLPPHDHGKHKGKKDGD